MEFLEFENMIDEMDVLFEATNVVGSTSIIKEKLYPKISAILSTDSGDRKFKQLVGNFMDKNNEKLHTSGPVYLIPFGDNDKNFYFSLFRLTAIEVKGYANEVIKQLNSTSDFKLLRGNPMFWVLYCCVRYYSINNNQKGLNAALAMYALSVYPSIFSNFFKYGVNEPVMQYTMDKLTDKYLMKQQGHVFGALFTSINNSYKFLKNSIKDGNDLETIRFIQRIHNDQKSMIKKICNQYMENHRKGLRVSLTKDSYDEVQFDDTEQNKSTLVATIGRKIMLAMINNGVDLRRAGYAAQMAGVSIADTRFYMSRILTDKYTEVIERFIESILFVYLYDNNKNREDINSREFVKFGEELFRKTNSNNENIQTIKSTLDKFATDVGVHEKFKRIPTQICYKRAIYLYSILSIMAYNQN